MFGYTEEGFECLFYVNRKNGFSITVRAGAIRIPYLDRLTIEQTAGWMDALVIFIFVFIVVGDALGGMGTYMAKYILN